MYDLFEDYINTYMLAMENKARGKVACEFSLHWQRNLLRMLEEFRTHSYEPSAYAFIKKKPCPRWITSSEFSLIVNDTHILKKLGPLLERRMTDRSFNNRIGMGTTAAINSVISDIYEVSEGFTNDSCTIVKIDIMGFFPHALQDVAYSQLSKVLEEDYHGEDKDFMRQLIMRCVYSYLTDRCEKLGALEDFADYPAYKNPQNKPDGVSGDIGRPLWQQLMNFYLNDFDHFVIDTCGLHYTRYVDDMVFVTNNKESLLAMMPIFREKLASIGCRLHPKKFYCQPYWHGVEFLGMVIKKDRAYPAKRSVRNFSAKIDYFNRRVRIRNLSSFISSMNSYLGIMKSVNAHKITLRMIRKINPDWWRFCHYNPDRVCIQANEGYSEKEILYRKYHLKLKDKHHGKKNQRRTHRPARAA